MEVPRLSFSGTEPSPSGWHYLEKHLQGQGILRIGSVVHLCVP